MMRNTVNLQFPTLALEPTPADPHGTARIKDVIMAIALVACANDLHPRTLPPNPAPEEVGEASMSLAIFVHQVPYGSTWASLKEWVDRMHEAGPCHNSTGQPCFVWVRLHSDQKEQQ